MRTQASPERSRGNRVHTGARRRFEDEDVERMYARYQTGLSLEQVAKEFGTSVTTVQGEFMRRGYPRRRGGSRTRPTETVTR